MEDQQKTELLQSEYLHIQQSLESYEKTQKEHAMLKGILQGELDIAEGKTYTLEEFLEIRRAALKGKYPKD